MNKNILGGFYLALAASIWGGMYVVSKYVLNFVPPLTLLWIRYAIALIVLFGILKFSKQDINLKKIEKKDLVLLIWLGFIGYFVSIALQFIGTRLSDAHTGALITSAKPTFIIIFAKLILKEKISIKKIVSLVISTFGILMIIGINENSSESLIGNMLFILAALSWALLSVYVKIASKKFTSLVITAYSILFAFIFTSPFAFLELLKENINLSNTSVILGILYLGLISTAAAFFLWNKGLEIIDASTGSIFFFFQPLVGTLLAWLMLKEKIDSNFFIGAFFLLLSVFIINSEKKQKIKV